jgi:integrase
MGERRRFHDLPATFVTWAKRQGRSDGWISDRTGHITKEMLDRYDRAARTLEEPRYVPPRHLRGDSRIARAPRQRSEFGSIEGTSN